MRLHYRFAICVGAWAAAATLTVIGTIQPELHPAIHLWQAFAIGIAVASTVSVSVGKAQAEVVEDLQPPPAPPKPLR